MVDYEAAARVVVEKNERVVEQIRALTGKARETAIQRRLRHACESYFWEQGDIEPLNAEVDMLLSYVRALIKQRKEPKPNDHDPQ